MCLLSMYPSQLSFPQHRQIAKLQAPALAGAAAQRRFPPVIALP